MKFLIIGLGIYGANLAADLAALGHEVVGADINSSLVESIKDLIGTAYIIDSTDEIALSALPLNNVDTVVVAIGENFGASIKTVALLKKLRVKRIFARAIDPLHESILEGIGVTRILTPEQRAATDLVHEMALGIGVEALEIDKSHYIMRFPIPRFLVGLPYSQLNLEHDYHLRLIAASRPTEERNVIGLHHKVFRLIDLLSEPDLLTATGDILAAFGTAKDFHRFIDIADS